MLGIFRSSDPLLPGSLDDDTQKRNPMSLSPKASKDKDVAPVPSSAWDAILEAAKDQVPSLDSDSSLSDCGEEPFIFQRKQPVLIPDLAEELAEDSAGGDDSRTWVPLTDTSLPEPVLVPVGLAIKLRSGQNARTQGLASQEGWPLKSYAEEPPMLLEDDLGALSFNTEGFQSAPWDSLGEATLTPKGEVGTEPSGAAWRDSAKRRALRRERRKMIEAELLHKVTRDTRDPACGDHSQAARAGPRSETPSELPREGQLVLSLQQIEEWDLDYILRSLPGREDRQGDGAPRTAWWAADLQRSQARTVLHSQDGLLEQLALLCAVQSRASASARKLPVDTAQDTEGQEARSRCASMEPGFQAKPGQKLADSVRLKTEPPTIFIDLRHTEPPKPPDDQTPGSSSHSSSDSEDDDDEDDREETWVLEARKSPGQQAALSSHNLRSCTGKSQLLQQLRAFRTGMALPQLPARKGPGAQKAHAPEDTTERKEQVPLCTEGQSTQDGLQGGHLGPESAREVLGPTLGQLQVLQDTKAHIGSRGLPN